jgi:endoglucanase
MRMHTAVRRTCWGAVALLVACLGIARAEPAQAYGTASQVVVSQAGYSTTAYKVAYLLATDVIADSSYRVWNGSTQVASGTAVDQGTVWGKRVYLIDFSGVAQNGTFTVESNGVSSHPFPIAADIWDSYKDEMTAFYRIQRSGIATADAYPTGYSSVAPSTKAFHGAGHLDDAASADGTQHYDLVGSWYDAGDYGKYAGNQWVAGEIALGYVRHAAAGTVQFDNDGNGVPDLVDEARWGSQYLIKVANAFGGAFYDLSNDAGFEHPELATDNVSGTADDRRIRNLSVGGSAKAAGSLAATARAINAAIAGGRIAAGQVADFQAFAAQCQAAAATFYTYAAANPSGPVGSYPTLGGVANSLLWADVELYLLTGQSSYKTDATAKINALSFTDVSSTNYWDQRPLAMAEFYPVADTTTQSHIRDLLTQQVDYFVSMADDTPYGVVDTFSTFGVNEPQASYLGDMVRYYELFGAQPALRAALRGAYWIFGANPWNISWVSGIGTDYVDFIHTRLDDQSYDHANTGIVVPGAMVSGPNIKNPQDVLSQSPWYVDQPLWADDVQQWRYNEPSISIEAGLLYTVTALSDINAAASGGGTQPERLPVTEPVIGDYVTGDVTVFAEPPSAKSAVDLGSTHTPMTLGGNGVWTGTFNVDSYAPYSNPRVPVRGLQSNGHYTYSATHVTVAPPLPDPSHPLLYDNFANGGTWGSQKLGWVNWYNQSGGTGTYSTATVDGRSVGVFAQTPSSSSSQAKFEPWHDYANFAGYRYLTVTMADPAYPNLRYKASISDGTNSCSLTNSTYRSAPATWSDVNLDLSVCPAINRSHVHLELWLQQTGGTYGELNIDEMKATDVASGAAPAVTAPGLSAATGNSQTQFVYTTTYTDTDNQAPLTVDVVIDGVIHHMTGTNPADTTYSDGKTYSFTTSLPRGSHAYYFRTTDTTSDAVRTGTQSGPVVGTG